MSNENSMVVVDLHAHRLKKQSPKNAMFKATYQVWDCFRGLYGEWVHCEFHIIAFDHIEAKRRAVLDLRDRDGQPIDYQNLEIIEAAYG